MPYFSIKVFQVVMACLTTLGFYNCLPNVRYWIEAHRFFPLRKELLHLENQTLELFVFSILISSVLIKLYIVIIVWYCYKYLVTLDSFRNMNTTSVGFVAGTLSTDELNNNGFKLVSCFEPWEPYAGVLFIRSAVFCQMMQSVKETTD